VNAKYICFTGTKMRIGAGLCPDMLQMAYNVRQSLQKGPKKRRRG